MLKRSLIFLFALIICFQAVIQTLIMLDWKVNQDIITARYCVNKSKPELKCNGQCQLAKRLRKIENEINLLDSKSEKQPKKELKNKQSEFTFLTQIFISLAKRNPKEYETGFGIYINQYQLLLEESIDHPPCFS